MAEYHVNGITFKQLSPMQNIVLWGLFKLNWRASMAQLALFCGKAKGTVIPHCRALVKKGFLEQVESEWVKTGGWRELTVLRFEATPWVKSEIRKAVNRTFPYKKITRSGSGERRYEI